MYRRQGEDRVVAMHNSERSAVNFIPRDPSIFSTSTGISSEDNFAARTHESRLVVSSRNCMLASSGNGPFVCLSGEITSAVPRVEQPSPIDEIILL